MKYLLFILSILIIFFLVSLSPPTIILGDSGEIASACFNLGIGHPPGYPTFILFGKIFTLLPIGDVAFRINLLSILFTVCVFVLLYLTTKNFLLIVYRNNSSLIDYFSMIIALIFVFSDDFYNISTNVKGGIYILQHIIILITLYSFLIYYLNPDKKFKYLLFYSLGFLPVAHQTSLFLMAILFFTSLFISYKLKEKFSYIPFLFFFLSLITSWLYLFIRYKSAENVWAGIDSIDLLLSYIGRKVYINQNDPAFTFGSGISKFLWYLKNYYQNFNFLFLFTIYGFFVLYKRLKNFFWFNIIVFFINLFLIIVFTYNGNSTEFFYVNKPFYLLNNMISIFYITTGIYSLSVFLKNKIKINQYILLFIVVLFTTTIIVNKYFKNNNSRNFLAYDHGLNILKTVNNDEKMFGKSDIYIFNVQYLQQVKKKYPDKIIYDQSGNVLNFSIYNNARKDGVLDIKIQEKSEIELYFNNKGKIYFMDMTSYPKYNLLTRPYGILNKLTEASVKINKSENLMRIYSIRDLFNYKNNDYFNRYILGRYLVRNAEYAAINSDLNKFEFYKNLSEKIAGDVPNILKNIASVYFHNLMDIKNTMTYLEKSMELDSYDFAALNLIIALYRELGMKDKVFYWLKFYYDREWRKENKEKLLKQIN
jgi:hypothetical protein